MCGDQAGFIEGAIRGCLGREPLVGGLLTPKQNRYLGHGPWPYDTGAEVGSRAVCRNAAVSSAPLNGATCVRAMSSPRSLSLPLIMLNYHRSVETCLGMSYGGDGSRCPRVLDYNYRIHTTSI